MGRLVLERLVINEWDLLGARKRDNSAVIEKGLTPHFLCGFSVLIRNKNWNLILN